MKAYLYLMPSDFANVPDKVMLRGHQLESYSGNWLYGELELPESWKVMESDYGDGFLVTDADEIITEVYTTKKRLKGDLIVSDVSVYDIKGKFLLKQHVIWH